MLVCRTEVSKSGQMPGPTDLQRPVAISVNMLNAYYAKSGIHRGPTVSLTPRSPHCVYGHEYKDPPSPHFFLLISVYLSYFIVFLVLIPVNFTSVFIHGHHSCSVDSTVAL